VAYLRGSRAGEGSTAPAFRARASLLGDIVGASPLYVGAPSARLPAQAGRPAMVYVNANDGMLHGFDAASGQERFAYIPSRVLPRLPLLAKQDYAGHHEYFVDGQIEVSEAVNRDDGQVGTFLASSLGRGGPQLFLLNVTDPAAVSEYSSSLALWEFSDAQDRNLGLLHQSPPRIVRLNDGHDYVLAPNGYNSATGSAGLFILPLARPAAWRPGTDYHWLAADNSGNNGLSAITPYDLDGNGSVDLVYAGDLKGNVWKFDLSASKPDRWQVGLGGQPLFRARGPSGLPQPITVAPALMPHPQAEGVPDAARSGLLVMVGTGRYLASCDQVGGRCAGEDSVASVYGLWDYGGTICQRSELQTQALSTLVLAGNHDLPLFAWWMRWGRAYERFAEQFGLDQEPVRHMGAFYVVGVNTTRAWRHERGSLSSAQIEHVARLLARAPPDAWRIVASHHPLVARDALDRAHRPHRADEAVQRWRTAGAQMLLSGHAHHPALLPAGSGLWASSAGTAVSHRLRHGAPNSLVVLSVEATGAAPGGQARTAARWDYDAASGEFTCVLRQPVGMADGG